MIGKVYLALIGCALVQSDSLWRRNRRSSSDEDSSPLASANSLAVTLNAENVINASCSQQEERTDDRTWKTRSEKNESNVRWSEMMDEETELGPVPERPSDDLESASSSNASRDDPGASNTIDTRTLSDEDIKILYQNFDELSLGERNTLLSVINLDEILRGLPEDIDDLTSEHSDDGKLLENEKTELGPVTVRPSDDLESASSSEYETDVSGESNVSQNDSGASDTTDIWMLLEKDVDILYQKSDKPSIAERHAPMSVIDSTEDSDDGKLLENEKTELGPVTVRPSDDLESASSSEYETDVSGESNVSQDDSGASDTTDIWKLLEKDVDILYQKSDKPSIAERHAPMSVIDSTEDSDDGKLLENEKTELGPVTVRPSDDLESASSSEYETDVSGESNVSQDDSGASDTTDIWKLLEKDVDILYQKSDKPSIAERHAPMSVIDSTVDSDDEELLENGKETRRKNDPTK